MREIKFRAWDRPYKKMCYSPKGIHNISGWLQAPEIFEVMQYTGLKDKYGVEGYHKDVVQMGPFLFVIEWDQRAAKFYLASVNKLDTMKYSLARLPKYPIVGNIYENPELLEEVKWLND